MKKLFTLVVAAFAALTIIAKEDIDISHIAVDGVITFDGQWQWKGINYGSKGDAGQDVYADKSAFEYVVFEYTSGACGDVNLIAQYEKDGTTGEYGDNYYTTTATCSVNPDGGILAVALDAEYSRSLNAVALQNHGTAGTLAIKAAYFASKTEYEAAKAEADKIEKIALLDETGGTHILKAKDWGWEAKWLDKDVADFNTLVFEIASVKGHGKVAIQGIPKNLPDLDLPESDEQQTYMVDMSSLTKLSQYAYQNLNKPDGEQYGKDDIEETTIVVTKVYLTSKTKDEISTGVSHTFVPTKANVNASIYNLAGQQVNKSYKGVVIQNGKKFIQK